MKFISGFDRSQAVLFPTAIDDLIATDNIVRVIDVFADSLNFEKLGFQNTKPPAEGRPPYHPADLLKLYLYGYLNRYRSSRVLERECKRNVEMIWLLRGLKPDHNTISNFRRDNPKAIKNVFRQTVTIAKNLDLIGGVLIAGDSSKFRAQNSKKNNYNQKKIKRHVEYIDRKLEEYNQALAEADGDEEKQEDIKKRIDKQQQRKANYEKLEKQLQETGEKQVSTSDPESRQLIVRNNITEVCYNVQSTVDAKNNLPIDYEVTNENDSKAMGRMVRRAKSIVRNSTFTTLFDKGYHSGSELQIAQELGITTLVAEKAPASTAPDPAYNVINFTYDPDLDCYICPQGEQLHTNGNVYTKHRGLSNETKFKQYRTKACKTCPVRERCTSAKNGKLIERNVFTPVFEQNRRNIEKGPELYRRRQAIVEHPFGTMKRQWGFDHILTKKGKQRATADIGLIFIAYNFRRLLTILGKSGLRQVLAKQIPSFFPIMDLGKAVSPIISPSIRMGHLLIAHFSPRLKWLILGGKLRWKVSF